MKTLMKLLAALAVTAFLVPVLYAWEYTEADLPDNPTTITGPVIGIGDYTTAGYAWGGGHSFSLTHFMSNPPGDDLSLTIDTRGLSDNGYGMQVDHFAVNQGLWFVGEKNFTLSMTSYLTALVAPYNLDIYQVSNTGGILIFDGDHFAYGYNINKWGQGKVVVTEDVYTEHFYDSVITVHEGILEINGILSRNFQPMSSHVVVGEDGILSGHGTIKTASFNVEGIFNPGGMTVDMYLGVDMNMLDDSIFKVDFTLEGTALLLTSGNITLGDNVTLDISNMAADTTILAGQVKSGDFFTFVTTSEGTFEWDGISTGDVLTYTKGEDSLQIDYSNGIVVVPEPTTWALMIGGLGALALLRRRRS